MLLHTTSMTSMTSMTNTTNTTSMTSTKNKTKKRTTKMNERYSDYTPTRKVVSNCNLMDICEHARDKHMSFVNRNVQHYAFFLPYGERSKWYEKVGYGDKL